MTDTADPAGGGPPADPHEPPPRCAHEWTLDAPTEGLAPSHRCVLADGQHTPHVCPCGVIDPPINGPASIDKEGNAPSIGTFGADVTAEAASEH